MTDQIKYASQLDENVPKDLSKGPRLDRSCTDLSCCFFLVLFTLLMVLISFVGLTLGNPSILSQPYDMNHHPCGVDDNAGYPYIYFPTPKTLRKNVCVSACPDANSKSVNCLKNSICPDGTLKQDVATGYIIYQTVTVADKICIPLNKEYFTQVMAAVDIDSFQKVASNMRNTWMICTGSIFFAIVVGFIFMYLVRLMAGSLIWSFILIIFISVAALGGAFIFQYYQLTDPPTLDKKITSSSSYKAMESAMSSFTDKDVVLVAGIILLSLAFVFILCICCILNKIRLAVSVIEASAHFMTDNPRIVLVPVVSFVVSVIFFAYWLIVALYVYSSGGVSSKDGTLPFGHVSITTDIKIFGFTHLFGLFWYEAFFAACQQMIIIGAVAFWYFQVPEVDDSHTTMSAKLFFKNHMGTAAFGSFLLGVLGLVKFIVGVLAAQAEIFKTKGEGSAIFTYIYKALYCFIWVFEKCFKHLTSTAYVWTMMDAKNFCPSAQKSLALYATNPVRMVLVGGIGEIFETLGSAAICAITTLSAYFIITHTAYYQSVVDSPITPIVVIAILSYYVGSFVMSLFGTVSEAMMVIFLMEENMGTNVKSSKCPEELRDFLTQNN